MQHLIVPNRGDPAKKSLPTEADSVTLLLMDREHILGTLRSHEAELKAAGLLHLRLFGSVARGDHRPDSDVDLLANFDQSKPITLFTIARHRYELADLLHEKVDLLSEDWLRGKVLESALAEAVHVF